MGLLKFNEWLKVNESYIVNEDFKTQTVKYISQGYQDSEIKKYLDDFRELRDKKYSELFKTNSEEILEIGAKSEITEERIKNFPIGQDRINIDKYKEFDDVIAVINWVSSIKKFGFSNFVAIEVEGETVFENEKIAIYHANNKHACIKYRGDKTYSWCVAGSGSQNAFSGYRNLPMHDEYSEPSFYFIKRKKATDIEFSKKRKGHDTGVFNDPWHFFVIQAAEDATYNRRYIVTSANNDGDETMTWDKILSISPELNGLEKYLKSIPRTSEEKEKYDLFQKMDEKRFIKLSYSDKEYYISNFSNVGLTDASFLSLPKDLKNKYISLNTELTDLQFKLVEEDKDLLKRYTEIVNRNWEPIIKDEIKLRDSQITAGEYLVLDKKLKSKLSKTLKDTVSSNFSQKLLYDGGRMTTLEEFKINSQFLYGSLLWRNDATPHFPYIVDSPDYVIRYRITPPNFSILSRINILKKEVDAVLETNPYAKNYIGIFLKLTNSLGNFNSYLKYLGITAEDFLNGLSKDELFILSQDKIKGEKEDDYRIINPHPGAKGRIESYYPWFRIKNPSETTWKTFAGGHTNNYFMKPLEEKDFTFEFDEYRYNNINDFIKDWGVRLVFIKYESEKEMSLGKYLEENPNIIVRVSKDYSVNNYIYKPQSSLLK